MGLAGGGTDVSPFSDEYGGCVFNATINRYSHTSLEPTNDDTIIFASPIHDDVEIIRAGEYVTPEGFYRLHKGVYNRIVKDFTHKPLSFKMTSFVDALPGSGLGTSSSLVVSIVGAFVEWLKLPLSEYDIAMLAYKIEREDLQLSGGKQDQYAATFGGFNFMEFGANDRVLVTPIHLRPRYLFEFEHNTLLYYTGSIHVSAKIIDEQKNNVVNKKQTSIDAMLKLKEQAIQMKEAVITGEIDKIGDILDFGWHYKKQMANSITTPAIDNIYNVAIQAGATGGKITGAGGGGYFIFYCPDLTKYKVIDALKPLGGRVEHFNFTDNGLTTWTI